MSLKRLLVLALYSSACAGSGASDLPTALPAAAPPPTALTMVYHVSDTMPLAGPGPIQYAHMSIEDGQLTIVGRQAAGAYPTYIDSITGTNFGDSLTIRITAGQGPFTAVSYRDYEARAFGLVTRPRWVRVYGCFDFGCYLDADTVLGAPMPGRRPPGW